MKIAAIHPDIDWEAQRGKKDKPRGRAVPKCV
jgi:hypothetical protein